MLIATAELLTVAVGRFPTISNWGPLWDYGPTDLFLVPLVVYDLKTRGRLHPATLWGGLFFVGSQPLRVAIGKTATWQAFAVWLTS